MEYGLSKLISMGSAGGVARVFDCYTVGSLSSPGTVSIFLL